MVGIRGETGKEGGAMLMHTNLAPTVCMAKKLQHPLCMLYVYHVICMTSLGSHTDRSVTKKIKPYFPKKSSRMLKVR